ncbi:unnamed protein product [Blepharisma stoltei]|uniref:Uncharacterized protein n=1 Tax=Blepharisma stoltei TaxID=1481888 RepID=A0AAU9IV32_9CILI|nr:unnamed protein product [Blepharisma stoltei]
MAFIQIQQNLLLISVFLFQQSQGFTFTSESSFSIEKGTGNQNCESYACKDPAQNYSKNTCLYYNTEFSMWYADPCSKSSQYCKQDTQNANDPHANYTCETYTSFNAALPGEYCEKIYMCNTAYTSGCSNNVCKAISSLDQACQNTKQCESGTYCYIPDQATQGTCQAQIPIDGECTSYKLCANNAICNYTSTVNNVPVGKCKAFGSFNNHDYVGSCDFLDGIHTFGYNDLCPSGYCAPSGNSYMCLESVTSSQGLPVLCNNDPINMINATTGCTSNKDSLLGVSVTSACDCANNYNAEAYCNLFSGDPTMAKFRQYLTKWTQSKEILKCNLMGRYDLLCVKAHWDKDNAAAYTYYFYAAYFYPEIVEADDCVLSVTNYGYKMAKKAYNDDLASLIGVSFLVMMALH